MKEAKKGQKVFNCVCLKLLPTGIILHMHSAGSLLHTTFCSQIPKLCTEFHVLWLARQCNTTSDYQDILRLFSDSRLPHSNSSRCVQSCPSLKTCQC